MLSIQWGNPRWEDRVWTLVLGRGWLLEIPHFVSAARQLSDSIEVIVKSKLCPAMKRVPSQVGKASLPFTFPGCPSLKLQANKCLWVGSERAILSAPRGGATCDCHSLSSVYMLTILQCIWPPGALKRDKHCPPGVLTSLLQRDCFPFGELPTWPYWGLSYDTHCVFSASKKQRDIECVNSQLGLMSLNCEKSWTESTWSVRTATCNLLFAGPHPVPGTWGCSETFKNPGNMHPLPFMTPGD